METRLFTFNYRPLQFLHHIEAIGSVPAIQSYNADLDEYTPDYELVPLILQPKLSVVDPSGVLEDGDYTNSMTNIKWYEVTGTAGSGVTRTLITASNTGYSIDTSENIGRLYVRKNFTPGVQVTLEFEGSFLDTRTNQTFTVHMNFALQSTQATSSPATLTIDSPEEFVWNPWRDAQTHTITARLMQGLAQLTNNVTFHWERKRADGTWSELNANVPDLGFTISQNTSQLTQVMSVAGSKAEMRVRATYPSMPTLTEKSPAKYFTLVRRLPDFEWDYGGVPEEIEPQVRFICPSLFVTIGDGLVTHPVFDSVNRRLGELRASWYGATNNPATPRTNIDVGHGESADVPTSLILDNHGMFVSLEMEDRGARSVCTSSGTPIKFTQNGVTKVVLNR